MTSATPKLPPRNVLTEVSRNDQRMLKWFEDVNRAVGVADGVAADLTAMETDIANLDAAVAGKADLAHTHAPADVIGLPEAIDDRVAALLVAGANVTLTYDDTAGTLTIAATGGGAGANGGDATLSFGAPPGSTVASVAVTGQTGILSSSRVRAWVQGSTADHSEYVHTRIFPGRIGLAAGDIIAGTGFTIHAETEMRLTGDVAVKWEWA